MNQVLLFDSDYTAPDRVYLSGKRYEHIVSVLQVGPNDTLKVGRLNGKQGVGVVTSISGTGIYLETELNQEPPVPLQLRMILALPRPKMFRRILHCVTVLGVKEIYVIGTWRVDKSYWDSPVLKDEKLFTTMVEGLEQACDTVLPVVYKRTLFKPFVEDELPALMKESRGLVAHPYAVSDCPVNQQGHITLALGPEGGFLPYEVGKFKDCGFEPVTIGRRILQVEQAVPFLIGRLK